MPSLKTLAPTSQLGVRIHTVCLPHTHSACACMYLINFWTSTSVLPYLVGVAYAFGPVVHVQWKCEPNNSRIEKDGKMFVKSSRIYGYGYVSRQSCAFFASLTAAPLYHTYQPCRRLHRVVLRLWCIPVFTFIFISSSSSLPSQFSDNETAIASAENKLT